MPKPNKIFVDFNKTSSVNFFTYKLARMTFRHEESKNRFLNALAEMLYLDDFNPETEIKNVLKLKSNINFFPSKWEDKDNVVAFKEAALMFLERLADGKEMEEIEKEFAPLLVVREEPQVEEGNWKSKLEEVLKSRKAA